MDKKNRIPRKAKKLYITWLIDTTAHKTGEHATVEKNDSGQWIETAESGKTYLVFVSMLRNGNVIQVDGIETDEEPQTVTTAAPTISENTSGSNAADSQSPLYIVQCKSSRRPWTDYSSPATLDECETIKARAEARRTCSTSGELLTYRIITATTSEESPEDVQTNTRSQEEPAQAETGTTGAPCTHDGPTAGESCTTSDDTPTTGADCTHGSPTGSQETPTETGEKGKSQIDPQTAPPRHESPKAEQTTTDGRKEPPRAAQRDEAKTHGPPLKAAAASQIPKRKHCKIGFYGPKISRKDFCSSFRHHFRSGKFQDKNSRPPGGYQKIAV